MVGVEVTACRVETILPFGCLGVVEDLVAVVHLGGVELAFSRNGVDSVHAFDGTRFVFIGISPRNGFIPIQPRLDGVSLPVFFDFEHFVASIGGIGEAFPNDRVAYPEYKLFVF